MVTRKQAIPLTPSVTAVKYLICFGSGATLLLFLYFVYLALFTLLALLFCVSVLVPSLFYSDELGQELVLNFPT